MQNQIVASFALQTLKQRLTEAGLVELVNIPTFAAIMTRRLKKESINEIVKTLTKD